MYLWLSQGGLFRSAASNTLASKLVVAAVGVCDGHTICVWYSVMLRRVCGHTGTPPTSMNITDFNF